VITVWPYPPGYGAGVVPPGCDVEQDATRAHTQAIGEALGAGRPDDPPAPRA
jgi:hypothetical protein